MNHVTIRRFALSGAAVSFGILTALMLVVSAMTDCAGLQSITRAQMLAADTPEIQVDILPKQLSCTSIVVESLCVYDGPFFEDGDPREVFNVAAIKVRNCGNSMIPYASVTVNTENVAYEFEGYLLSPGSCVLIPEKNALELTQRQIVDCFGWTTVQKEVNSADVVIEQTAEGGLRAINQTKQDLKNFTVYYKTYLKDADLYIGGRPFEAQINLLPADSSSVILPAYYAPGYSAVLCWRVSTSYI